MPLAPTTYYEPMPSSPAPSLHLDGGSSIYSDEPSSISSSLGSSFTNRRPPLPPMTSSFQPRLQSKVAVIRPNSTSLLCRSPSPRLPLHLRSSSSIYSPRSSSACSLRSPSTCSQRSASACSLRSGIDRSPTPRRMYPQEVSRDDELDLEELSRKEQAPVVFDASINFVLGIDKQKVRQSFRPTASHLEPETASSYLSTKISNFLQRTDHIMDEWKRLGKSSGDEASSMCESPDGRSKSRSLQKSKSATNILIKGYQLFSRSNSLTKSPSRPVSRLSEESEDDEDEGEEDRTMSQCDEEVALEEDCAQECLRFVFCTYVFLDYTVLLCRRFV